MHLVSVFQQSLYLELAIIDLEQMGISKEKILALPLDKNGQPLNVVKATHQEAHSYVDLVFILGMLGMLLGAIYGFVLVWGPIIWGLIGMVAGALIGLVIELLVSGSKMFQQSTTADVVLIVDCDDNQASTVERILWNHQALGIAKQPVLTSD